MRTGRHTSVIFVVCLTSVLAVSICVALKRDEITSYPPDWPHRAPWKLNKEFLGPSERPIRFVVEVARGLQPKKEGLDYLVEIAAKYSEQPASWVLAGSPDAPNVIWTIPEENAARGAAVYHGSEDPTDVANRLSGDVTDSIRYSNEIPACPVDLSATDMTYVFIRFLGKWGDSYGATVTVEGALECAGRQFHIIYLAQDAIALRRPPGFSREFLEKRALVHEYGHVLGLATNPAHGGWMDTINYRRGAHCVNRECAVSIPSPKALLRGLMSDYCQDCQEDIRQARSHWFDGVAFPEAARLPQPDPYAIVAPPEELSVPTWRRGLETSQVRKIRDASADRQDGTTPRKQVRSAPLLRGATRHRVDRPGGPRTTKDRGSLLHFRGRPQRCATGVVDSRGRGFLER